MESQNELETMMTMTMMTMTIDDYGDCVRTYGCPYVERLVQSVQVQMSVVHRGQRSQTVIQAQQSTETAVHAVTGRLPDCYTGPAVH